jgi:hypothetical protein
MVRFLLCYEEKKVHILQKKLLRLKEIRWLDKVLLWLKLDFFFFAQSNCFL